MIRNHSSLLILLFLSPFFSFGQQQLKGFVVDALTLNPLEGVSIRQGDDITTSNAQGLFILPFEKNGELRFEKDGFETGSFVLGEAPRVLYVSLQPMSKKLEEVQITAFASDRKLVETAGSIASLSAIDLQRADNSSVLNAFNLVPGVRMDSRGAGGSSRISIRGSTLRAPFGVRNLKAYWNGIPLTSPDGSTPIEVIDVNQLQQVEILKGPSSSLYGAGTGGAILFRSERPTEQGTEFRLGGTTGSFGLTRSQTKVYTNTHNLYINVNYVRHSYEGYREQESVDKNLLNLTAQIFPDEKRIISLYAYHFDGGWDLPGALNPTQVEENPRQAVPFSVNGNASLYRKRTRIGIAQQYYFNENWSNTTSVYGNFTEKENPFGTSPFFNGYKIEGAQGMGLRSTFTYTKNLGKVRSQLNFGTEYLTELNTLREYTNVSGTPGSLYEDGNTRSTNWTVFGQAEFIFPADFIATLGASYNEVGYQYEDYFLPDSIDYSNDLGFDPVISPRFALLKKLTDDLSVHGSISYGFSPPTLWEVVAPSGAIQTDLQPEQGINYELGLKGSMLKGRLSGDVVAYQMNLNNAILPQVVASGETFFFNAGQTFQRGIEATIQGYLIENDQQFFQAVKLWANGAFQDYTFGDYDKEGDQLEGNLLTGVPTRVVNVGLDIETSAGLYAFLTFRNIGETPLNDSNADFADAYSLIEARIGYGQNMGERWKLDVFAGGNNLTNTSYTSFLQVNGFGGRFFNPAPTRNFYIGASVGFVVR